jgi:leader peptidase (prepilin peptidase) / N-methyltransferase
VPVTGLVITFSVVLGLLVGSFLNVVIWRYPRGESVRHPPSHCPRCDERLRPLDLVPVLSWLALRGRCRYCGGAVSGRYPLVEALTGVLFGLVAWRFGWSWELPPYLALVAVLVALSGIDLDTKTLPRRIIYLGGAIGVPLLAIAALANDEPRRLWTAALGAVLAFAFFLLLHLLAPGSMGFGDVRLSALLGLYLGWLGLLHVPVGLFLGFVFGAAVGIALMVVKKAGRKTAVPFGPFMAAGAIVAILLGGPIIDVWLPG